ncbi:MAG: SRPBCC family protein [bacterium]
MLKEQKLESENPAKDARKQQLIDATIDCIYNYGLEQTTISRVTKAAKLSGGIVNFYFQSKDKLLLGTLTSIRDEFEREILQSTSMEHSPADALRHIIDVHFNPSLCRPEKIAVWHAFASARRTREDYNKICGGLENKLMELLTQQFRQICQKTNSSHFDPSLLARSLNGILDSFWQDNLYSPDSFNAARAKNKCIQYLESLFPEVFNTDQPVQTLHDTAPTVANSSTVDLLAPWTYQNQEFLDLEMERLFKPNWMLAGHISELQSPRDYLTFDGFGERALIIRGHDNNIRAFHNVCRHRGARLLEGSGNNCPHALTCPFHGWTYDLTGKLIGIPAQNTFDGLDPAANGLVPLDFEIWMGFIFIRFKSGGKSMKRTLAPVEHLIAPYQTENMSKLPGTEYRELRPYNWKVIHDIDNEGYHVPIGHPSLQQLYGKKYTDEYIGDIAVSKGYLNEKQGKLWSVRHYQNLLPRFDHLPDEYQRLWLYIGVFPNLVLGLYPDCIEVYMTLPKSTGETWFSGCSYGLPDDRRQVSAARFLNHRINHITDREDDSFVSWMQEGMRSSAFPQQKLSSLEHGVRRFHQQIQKALPVARLENSPLPGTVTSINRSLAVESQP